MKEIFKIEDDQLLENIVNTLIFILTKHFVGNSIRFIEWTSGLLINLYCPQLFIGIKNIVLTKILIRKNCEQLYWKENNVTLFCLKSTRIISKN